MFPGIDIEMLTDQGLFTVAKGSRSYGSFPRQQVSLFSMTPELPINSEGLKWELKERCLSTWWEGTLNEALADRFSVAGGKIIVFQTYDPKL